MKVYVVWEECHGDVTYWSDEELAKRECGRILDGIYGGDRSLMDAMVGIDEHEIDGESFVGAGGDAE